MDLTRVQNYDILLGSCEIRGIPMTMHLLPAYFTSTRTAKSKSTTVKKMTAHDQWLMKRGLHPSQIAAKKRQVGEYKNDLPDYSLDRDSGKLGNSVGNGFARGIMTNLHKERPEVQREIMLKASRCMPLFNKGGYAYATPETDMTTVGSKSRRG